MLLSTVLYPENELFTSTMVEGQSLHLNFQASEREIVLYIYREREREREMMSGKNLFVPPRSVEIISRNSDTVPSQSCIEFDFMFPSHCGSL